MLSVFLSVENMFNLEAGSVKRNEKIHNKARKTHKMLSGYMFHEKRQTGLWRPSGMGSWNLNEVSHVVEVSV